MKDEESSQSAELNADHGDMDPSFGAGLGGFVIAHQSPLAHQPAEGAFHYPTAWQHGEASVSWERLTTSTANLGWSLLTHWANVSPV